MNTFYLSVTTPRKLLTVRIWSIWSQASFKAEVWSICLNTAFVTSMKVIRLLIIGSIVRWYVSVNWCFGQFKSCILTYEYVWWVCTYVAVWVHYFQCSIASFKDSFDLFLFFHILEKGVFILPCVSKIRFPEHCLERWQGLPNLNSKTVWYCVVL